VVALVAVMQVAWPSSIIAVTVIGIQISAMTTRASAIARTAGKDGCDHWFICWNPYHYLQRDDENYEGCDHNDDACTLGTFNGYYEEYLGSFDDDEESDEEEDAYDEDNQDEYNSDEYEVAYDDGDESDDEDEGVDEYSGDRLQRIARDIQDSSDQQFTCECVYSIEGDPVNAAVVIPDKAVRITTELERCLTDDELAFVLSHEAAHMKHKDDERFAKRCEEVVDEAFDAAKNVHRSLKERGDGFIARNAAAAAAGTLGMLAAPVKLIVKSRNKNWRQIVTQ